MFARVASEAGKSQLSGQTAPGFEQALIRLAPGTMTQAPVGNRYGLHIIRLDRKIEGGELPFEARGQPHR
jgi:parvulin-like peptidyl-prolyl isomerase